VARAVFIDRDDTLIANDGDLGDPTRVVLLDGAGAAVALLRRAGFRTVVVTNQGGVARGRYDECAVHAVHRRIEALLSVDARSSPAIDLYLFCPFHPEGSVDRYRREHFWRKPSPGMLHAAAAALALDLGRSWLVGDAERDVEAGLAAGCRTVRIGGGEPTRAELRCADLRTAAAAILAAEDAERADTGVESARSENPHG